MMRSHGLKLLIVALLAAFCLSLLISCSSDDVSPACAAYAAGKAGELQVAHREAEELILPSEFVRAFSLWAGGADEEICKNVIFDNNPRYVKDYLERLGKTPEELLALMNEKAKSFGDLTFGSLAGLRDAEEELYRLYEREAPDFTESRGTLEAVKNAAEVFSQDEALIAVLSKGGVTLADGTNKTRSAPLVSRNSQYHLAEARWYLSGNAVKDGKQVFVAVGEVRDGGTAYAAVCIDSGDDSPVNYASVDVANLCGQVLGQNYGLKYMPSKSEDVADQPLGYQVLWYAIVIILIAAGVMLAVAVTIGVVRTIRRNREGRKKYAPPEDEENKLLR